MQVFCEVHIYISYKYLKLSLKLVSLLVIAAKKRRKEIRGEGWRVEGCSQIAQYSQRVRRFQGLVNSTVHVVPNMVSFKISLHLTICANCPLMAEVMENCENSEGGLRNE